MSNQIPKLRAASNMVELARDSKSMPCRSRVLMGRAYAYQNAERASRSPQDRRETARLLFQIFRDELAEQGACKVKKRGRR